MSTVYAQNTIAKTLGYRGVKDADRVAYEVLEALRNDGLHLITVPTFTTDPAEDTAEYAVATGRMAHYTATPQPIKRELTVTVDDETLSIRTEVSGHAALYGADAWLREHMRRKMGIDLLAELWRRLDPESAIVVEPTEGE